MSDPVSLASLFDAAEQAALSGDFAAASRLLGDAARAQEAALGPDHLDLANTLNNLAVAHERCGQLDAAEREYRRAHAIAARTLPADDPLVMTSAQNLREFCQANNRPVDEPPSAMSLADETPDPVTLPVIATPALAASPVQADVPTVPIEPLPITFAAESGAAESGAGQWGAVESSAVQPPPPRPRPSPAPAPAPLPSAAPVPSRPAVTTPAAAPPPRRVSIPLLIAIGAVAALVIWLLAGRRQPAPSAASDGTPDASSVSPAPAASGVAPAAAPKASRGPAPPAAAPAQAGGSVPSGTGGLTIGEAQLCTSLASSYRCDVAGSTVRPGRLVFYTRLVADRDTSVVHRWYRGDQLRQAVRLDVPARRQGFRTYSRGTVTAGDGEWRVELRSRDGQLLHTERFTVR